MTLFIIATFLFLAGSAFDFYTSLRIKDFGGYEWNPLMRDLAGRFLPMRNAVATGVFYALNVIAFATFMHGWQPSAVLIFVGALRAIVAGFNYSKQMS